MSVNFSGKRSPCDIAKMRAQQLRKVRQEVNPLRARSQYGEPVIFQKLKEKSNISRGSRVMSDPEIPSALVILNAKGLFGGKKGAESKTETRYAPVGKMSEEGCKPMFCDPSNNNNGRVSDLRKRFESLERETVVSSVGGEFLNPLHKGNQAAVSSAHRTKEVRIDAPTKLEKALNENDRALEKKRNSKVADSENLSQNEYLDTTKISKTLPGKLDNVVEIPNISTKQSNSSLTMEDAKLKETSNESVKESELMTPPPPNRPPPRHPVHSPKKEPLKYCRDKPGDENAVSVSKEDVEENVLQQESILEGEQNTGSKTFSNSGSTLDGNDTSSGFDIDDEDSDDWGSDFDEDGEEKEENESSSKHDSHSSHGSSFEADPIIEFPDAVSKKLYNIVSEILSTERAYVRRLYLLDQVFYHRLNTECCAQGSVPGEALNDIFSNIQAIHQLHRDFLLPKLEARIKDWANNNQIGDILKGLAPFLKMYTLYVGNFDKATETLSTWMKKSPAMTAVIEEIQKSKECENLTLQHHMLEPVQRVPRYQLLLKDYLSKLPEDSEDLKNTSDALGIISESARHANDSMKKTERFKTLLDIQDRIGDDFPLITASREFVMEGEFKKVAARTSETHQERTLMLFNDVLLCCAKFPGSNKYKVKVEMDLYGMEIRTEDEDLEIENAFRITSKQRVMDFTAPNAEARETFVNKLKEAVDECTNKRDSYKKSSNVVVLKEGELGKKAPAWVRDEAVSMCMLCDVMFTKLRRRHHCRACGRVVCGNCSGYKAALEFKNGKMEKVCEVCHRILVKGSSEEKAKEAVVKGKSILKIDSDKKIWYSGYLNFKMRGDKSWQKRWFVLSSDFVLFRYKAKKDIKAELTLPLPGHNVDKPSLADEVDRKNVFKVHHKNVRVYLFQAQNEDSVDRWMEILTKATKAEQVDTEEE